VDPGGSKSVNVIVPEKGELRIQTTGWEDDNDGYYGHSFLYWLLLPTFSPVGPSKSGALNTDDKIGFINGRYNAANSFGIGFHPENSGTSGPSNTAGDFILNYRIEQLSISPPTTRPPAQLPSEPTQPPLLR
jgi:hypothetical protein